MRRPDDLVVLKEAAVLVGRSVNTMRLWVRNGELTGWREIEGDPNSRLLLSRQEVLLLAARAKPVHPGGPRPEDLEENDGGMEPALACLTEAALSVPEPGTADPGRPAADGGSVAASPVTPASAPIQPEPAAPVAAPVPPVAHPAPAPIHRPDPRDEQLVATRMMIAALTAERDGLKAVIEAQKMTVAALEARCRDLEFRADSERLRATEHHDRLVSADAELRALQQHQRLPWYQRLLGATAALPEPKG